MEWIEETSAKCDTCSKCENHGDHGDEFTVDVNEIIRIHGELKKRLETFKGLHGEFDDAVAESDIEDCVTSLALLVEGFEDELNELEAEVLP